MCARVQNGAKALWCSEHFFLTVVFAAIMAAEELPNFALEFDCLQETSTQRKSLSEKELDDFIKEQRNPRTVTKTAQDVRKFKTFLEAEPYKETRKLTDIPPNELDNYLCHFLLEIRKADGQNYEPDSLTSFRNSIDRYLRENSYGFSLVENIEFTKHREVLKAKRKQLKGKGKGRKKNAAQPISKSEREKLYEEGHLGTKDPQTLQTTVWFNNCIHFGMRSVQEHYDMQWGDVSEKTTIDGKMYLEMEERLSKGRDGSVPGTHSDRAFKPKMFRTGEPNCPVETFLIYKNHRPRQMLEPNAPFYLQAINNPSGEVWFKNQRLGVNSLGRLLKQVGEKAGVNVRNYSARKTLLTDLCDANVPAYRIIQLSGHKSVESIQDYHKKAKFENQEEMSRILSSSTEHEKAEKAVVVCQPNQSKVSPSSCESDVRTPNIFGPNTTISGGTVTINFVAGSSQATTSTSSSPTPKRKCFKRIRVIESDSSQES